MTTQAEQIVPQPPAEPDKHQRVDSLSETIPSLASAAPSAEFLRLIPHEFARRHFILSLGHEESESISDIQPRQLAENSTTVELLAVCDRTLPAAIFNVGVRLGRNVRAISFSADALASAIDREYTRDRTDASIPPGLEAPSANVEGSVDVEADLAKAVRDAEQDLLNTHGKAPAVRLVDLILFEAVQKNCSDVHVQPTRDRTLVRYRLDGALHTARELPASLATAVVSRVKVMGRLDVAEHRSPQDGRATVSIGGSHHASTNDPSARRVDLRISTLPSTYGERVVIRLLDTARSLHLLSFSTLGMPADIERKYLDQVSKTSGIVLSTGPTGSGKTTTLYTTLAWITQTNAGGTARGCELNMMTVEDPVEYDLAGGGLAVSQTQVDPKKNVTFATGLRHILRQDPDVIMVGEIRDEETARIAVQASLTGHLVLSTLHTNDAASALARLIDLGVEPFLVSSSLSAVLAQRLVRRLHHPCRGQGCDECLTTGYKGRTGVFELLVVDAMVRDMVSQRRSALDIKAAAQQAGMVTLKQAGEQLVRRGMTTAQEVTRVIEAIDEDLAVDSPADISSELQSS